MRIGSISTFALSSFLVVGCAGDRSDWGGAVRDSAGVAIVENTGQGMWSEREGWTVDHELQIGSLEGDPEYQFGQIGWMAVDSEDRIYVLDAQAQLVKVFSPNGEYLRSMGGQGSGPGELKGAIFIFVTPGDTVLVPDVQNQRINRYSPEGASLGSARLPLENGLPMLFKGTDTGVIAAQLRPFALPGQEAITDSMDVIVTVNTDGTIGDTLMTFRSGETFKMSGGAPEINIYSAEPAWHVTDSGKLLFGVNDQYRIGIYSEGQELEKVLTMPFERRPVGEEDRSSVMKFLERMWADAGVPAQMMPQLRNMVHFGEFFPAFSNVLTGPQGTIWVQHIQPASDLSEEELEDYNLLEESGAPDWDVFDAEGRFLGVVTMPERFAPRIIREEKIYGVWRDDLDVQYVVRLGIVGPESAANVTMR